MYSIEIIEILHNLSRQRVDLKEFFNSFNMLKRFLHEAIETGRERYLYLGNAILKQNIEESVK